jgi:hypothetical protein
MQGYSAADERGGTQRAATVAKTDSLSRRGFAATRGIVVVFGVSLRTDDRGGRGSQIASETSG